jgi:hypothetical protein
MFVSLVLLEAGADFATCVRREQRAGRQFTDRSQTLHTGFARAD